MRRHRVSLVGVLGVLLFAPLVHADILPPTLSFQVDGGAAVLCQDGGACDLNPLAGVVTFAGALGGVYGVNVTTGLTKPLLSGAQMDLNSINVQSLAGGTHTLLVMFSETGFTLNGGAAADFGGTNFGTTVRYQSYFDSTDTLFGTGTLIGDSGVQTAGAYSGSFYAPVSSATPYSMTQKLAITSSGAGSVFSGDFSVRVPEPAGVAVELLGAAVLVAFGARKWRLCRN